MVVLSHIVAALAQSGFATGLGLAVAAVSVVVAIGLVLAVVVRVVGCTVQEAADSIATVLCAIRGPRRRKRR